MIGTGELITIGVLAISVIASYVTLKVQFERHEKEDSNNFKEIAESRKDNLASIEKDFDNIRVQLKEIYSRIQMIEIKQSAYDENSKHVMSMLAEMKSQLVAIEGLLRSRRSSDA